MTVAIQIPDWLTAPEVEREPPHALRYVAPAHGKPIHIYALLDPETGEPRYIGQSFRPRERLRNHINEVSGCHRSHWLQSLKARGLEPVMVILETIEGAWPWQEAERHWIALGRAQGWRLTNNTSGGDGAPDLPPETRARMAKVWLGRKHRPESLAKLKAARALRPGHSAETRARMSAAQAGRKITWGAKIAEAVRKLTPSDVATIAARLGAGEMVKTLAAEYGVHRTTISKVKSGTYFILLLAIFVTGGGGLVKSLRAPFPWFGGKSRAAHLVWAAFGDVPNYVEPFAGSLAVLLGRPTPPRIETVNDKDACISNFWRAVQAAADDVARWADWPVNEVDLHARHKWLVARSPQLRADLDADPEYFDAKFAGWWVWGICQWIGSGWCWTREERGRDQLKNRKHPDLHRGHGVHSRGTNTAEYRQRPALTGALGVLKRDRDLAGAVDWKKRPQLGKGGRGVLGTTWNQMPAIGGSRGASGSGVHASGRSVDLIVEWMRALQERLRRVRVCCGDWKRVLGPSPTVRIGVTGVLLDPPYSGDAERDPSLYTHDDLEVAHAARAWAIEHSDNPKLRIALCGYEGEHEMPSTWRCVPWKAVGGYAASAGNHANAKRERIWFSPHCLPVEERQPSLFNLGGAA